jgi:PPM family protein phosphatase
LIPAEHPHIKVFSATHPGMRGKNNEDRFGVSSFQPAADKGVPSILAIVSDGIGGHRAGEVAAGLAVETITRVVAESSPADPENVLREGIIRASEIIREQAEADIGKKGMGATCACVWVIGNRLYAASVGDSRIYLVRGETIRKLSTDHTWVQEAIEVGLLDPEQARNHPNAHVIRRYLGSPQTVVPDFRLRLNPDETDEQALKNQGLRLISGDFLLLCSDGLTDLVDDSEILAALKTKDLDSATNWLVELANERGGHDNITIIALQMPRKNAAVAAFPEPPPAAAQPRRLFTLPFALSCAGLGLFLIFFLVVGGGFLAWYLSQPDATATITTTHEPFPTITHTQVIETPSTPVIETPPTPVIPINTPDPLETPLFPATPTSTPPQLRVTLTPWPTSTPGPGLFTPTLPTQ